MKLVNSLRSHYNEHNYSQFSVESSNQKDGFINKQLDNKSEMAQYRLAYRKNSIADDLKHQQQNSALIAEYARLPIDKRALEQDAQIGKSESSNQDSEEDKKDSESANDDSEDLAPA